MRQLKLAFRTLFKTPFVTAIAILSLALGIGANTAMFSVFHELLLRPLPVPHPETLVNFAAPGPKPGSTSCGAAGDCSAVFSYPMFRDLERDQTMFTGIAAHVLFSANIGVNGETLGGNGVQVSGSYFPVLGLNPVLGRLLTPAGDAVLDEPREAVLSFAYWQSRFASSPDVVGRPIVINGQSVTIVGVTPEGFAGTTNMVGRSPDVFVPITLRHVLQPTFTGFDNRRAYWAYVFGRLKPGVSIADARAAMNVKYHTIINEIEVPLQQGQSPQTLASFRAKPLLIEPGTYGQTRARAAARLPLLMLLGLTSVVLLIACANVANLLLARAAGRTTEIAIRLAIGAGRRHLIGQLLLESCLLAGLAGLAGLVVSQWTLALLLRVMPGEGTAVPVFGLDATALGFATLVSVATGILFGLFPALHATRPDLAVALRNQSGQPAGAKSAAWFRNSLVVSQIAMSMTLLIVAGLLARSLLNVTRVNLGMTVDRVLTFTISPRLNGYTPERTLALFGQLEDGLRAMPGTTGVTSATVGLLAGNDWGTGVNVQGFSSGPDTDVGVNANRVGTEFFSTLGGRLLAGREFTTADGPAAPRVVIVNEAFARKFDMGRDVVGKRIALDRVATPDIEIVGLVADMKYSDVKATVPPQIYLPYRQDAQIGASTFYVRTAAQPETAFNTVRRLMTTLDQNLPVGGLRTMTEQVNANVFADTLISSLTAAFALLATLLASIGVYGVLAYTVSQRTREFGLRMALGAAPGHVRGLVLRHVAWMTAIGAGVGLVAALALGRVIAAQLFQVTGHDVLVLGVSVVVLGLIALVAGLVPAVRASRVDPMKALRYE